MEIRITIQEEEFQYMDGDPGAYHSEEVEEILGRVPPWIVRWGVTLIFLIFLGVIAGCYFIKFPNMVSAPVIITTEHPPADLIAGTMGRIEKMFVSDGQEVKAGEEVALLYSRAGYEDVLAVYDSLMLNYPDHRRLVYSPWIEEEYVLGEIQGTFMEFKKICSDFRFYLEADNTGMKQRLIREQMSRSTDYYNKLSLHKNNMEKQERGKVDDLEDTMISTEMDILVMEQRLVELDMQRLNETASFERQVEQARQRLLAQIDQWMHHYVVYSPIDGTVTFTKYWSSNQTVMTGERIASVVPGDNTHVIGRMIVPTNGFGKVAVGQRVNIKLYSYPYMEYGILTGYISTISKVPDEGGYTVEVAFPEKLETSYNKELVLIQSMDGTADIITDEQRLIMRFLDPIKAVFDKGR